MLDTMKKLSPVRSIVLGCILMLSIPISIAEINVRMAAVVLICPMVPSVLLKLLAMSMSSRLRIVSAG